ETSASTSSGVCALEMTSSRGLSEIPILTSTANLRTLEFCAVPARLVEPGRTVAHTRARPQRTGSIGVTAVHYLELRIRSNVAHAVSHRPHPAELQTEDRHAFGMRGLHTVEKGGDTVQVAGGREDQFG